ncbi:MAG TPA: ROK family protein [Patescibacteria group bacterium]|nr:ROK family protein [Patescibacteria group bacterium]
MTSVAARPLLVGADIGGTKTAVIVARREGPLLARHVEPTAGDPARAAERVGSAILAALAAAGATPADVAAVGVGVPGRVDREKGRVTLALNMGWHDLTLGPVLEARLGVPTVLENDVRAAALGLYRRKVAGDLQSLAYLAVGTGIAAGVVLAGRLHLGSHRLAGEIGHVPIDRDGPRCACGLRGCLEAVASGSAIAARGGTGDGAEAVFRAAAAGNHEAARIIDDAGRSVAWAIQLLVLAYDVERVVLGGGVTHAGDAFLAPVRRELDRLRAVSPLARELLTDDLVHLLPADADAGAWGALSLAGRDLEPGDGAGDAQWREVRTR